MKALTLMYHDVITEGQPEASGFPGPYVARYKIPAVRFRQQIAAMTGLHSGFARTVVDHLRHPQGGNPLFLTFDDGGQSAVNCIADTLEEYGWRGHFFVPTAYIGQATFLSPQQVRDLWRRGHIVGSHSHTHPQNISRLDARALADEWETSVKTLADIIGESVSVASVPGGFSSRRVTLAAACAGIKALFTSEPIMTVRVVAGCFVFGRYTVMNAMTMQDVLALVHQRVVSRLEQYLTWNVRKLTKQVLGALYPKLKRGLLDVLKSEKQF
jgi:peptidoglycan/xylan/chitin deacetylase (PgdA/CDA1 family)